MSALLKSDVSEGAFPKGNNRSSLQNAIYDLIDHAHSDSDLYAQFCVFTKQLTNAENCKIIQINSAQIDYLHGQPSDITYNGLSIHSIIGELHKNSALNITIADTQSYRTIRIINIQLKDRLADGFYVILESINETPLAAAMAQERFELAATIFTQILSNRTKKQTHDENIINIFLKNSRLKHKAQSLADLLAKKLQASLVCIAPIHAFTIQKKSLTASEMIAESLRTQISVIMSEAIENKNSSLSPDNTNIETLAALQLQKSLGGGFSIYTQFNDEGEGCAILTRQTNIEPDQTDMRIMANGFENFYINKFTRRIPNAINNLPFIKKLPARYRLAAVFILPFAGLLLPIPHTVKGEAAIVPVHQQVIAAPIVGRLETVLVEPSEFVTANETILATIDTNDLQAERDALKAQHASHLTEWQIQRANGDAAKARLAKLRAEEVTAQIALTDFRLESSNLRSPISGYVQGENQKKNIGSTLRQGDELFRVVQKESTRVELSINATDAARLNSDNLSMTLRLEAHPGTKYEVKNIEFYPVAEFSKDQTILRGIGAIDKPLETSSDRVLSGMQGTVKTDVGLRPLIIHVLAEPFRKLRIFLGV